MSDRHLTINANPVNSIVFFIFIIASFYSSSTYAVDTPDASTMLSNLASTIPQFMKLVTAVAYVMGMALIIKGLMALKQYGEARTMMSTQQELKGPLIMICVGAALLYLPSSVDAGLTTFWTIPNPYGYQDSSSDQWATLIENCFLIWHLINRFLRR